MTFTYNQHKHSSQIPSIQVDGQDVSRADFWKATIDANVKTLPTASAAPVYIATGGGYGAYGDLIGQMKDTGSIAADIPSIRGEQFRDLPAFEAEKESVREQIRQHDPLATPQQVEVLLRSFYSDEVNTKLAKEVVKSAIANQQSVIHESASIYEDTIERAELAKANGVKTVLIAGDCNHLDAVKDRVGDDAYNTIVSYKKFAARFEKELVPLFDEIQLYDTNSKPHVLIAEKKGAGQPLEIYDQVAYTQFKAKALLDPNKFKTRHTDSNPTAVEHKEREPKLDVPPRP